MKTTDGEDPRDEMHRHARLQTSVLYTLLAGSVLAFTVTIWAPIFQ